MRKANYWVAIILAVIAGCIGIQEFYVRRTVAGIFAVLFCWTGIPAIVGYIEAIVWLFNGEDEFNSKFNKINNKPLNS